MIAQFLLGVLFSAVFVRSLRPILPHVTEVQVDHEKNGNVGFHVGRMERLGFHGDWYLLKAVDVIANDVTTFVETGTHSASTLHYIARTYPSMSRVYSCEPVREWYDISKHNMEFVPPADSSWKSRVKIWKDTSQNMMKDLLRTEPNIVNRDALFWFDAHGQKLFEWPLRDEIAFVVNNWESDAFVFVDDFKVPHDLSFGFDVVDGQECSFDFIKDSIPNDVTYRVYYPSYKERTSNHHPLRGWTMIHFPRRHTSKIRRFDVDYPDIFMLAHRSNDMPSCTNKPPHLEIVKPLQDISDPIRADEGTIRVAIRYDCFSVSARTQGKLCIYIDATGPQEFGEKLNTCMDSLDSNENTKITPNGNIWEVEISGLQNTGKYAMNAELRLHNQLQSPKQHVIFNVIV